MNKVETKTYKVINYTDMTKELENWVVNYDMICSNDTLVKVHLDFFSKAAIQQEYEVDKDNNPELTLDKWLEDNYLRRNYEFLKCFPEGTFNDGDEILLNICW